MHLSCILPPHSFAYELVCNILITYTFNVVKYYSIFNSLFLGKPELSIQVGRLAILDAKKAVSQLFLDKTRKYFIFDEFNVYASDVAIDLLNKSRSANITCIPAFQSLSNLNKAGGVALRNQVIENCNNYIIMRQNSYDSSAEWEKVIGQEKTTILTHRVLMV